MYLEQDQEALEEVYPQGEKVRGPDLCDCSWLVLVT